LSAVTGLVGFETAQRWGSLFPQNAWESALPAACRAPQTRQQALSSVVPRLALLLFLSTPLFSTARHRTLPTLRLPLLLSIYSSGGRLGHQSGESLLPHSAGVGTREVAVA
jgi:hypothetical protein